MSHPVNDQIIEDWIDSLGVDRNMIQAAPEMLKALELVLVHLEKKENKFSYDVHLIRSVIKKAKGEK